MNIQTSSLENPLSFEKKFILVCLVNIQNRLVLVTQLLIQIEPQPLKSDLRSIELARETLK